MRRLAAVLLLAAALPAAAPQRPAPGFSVKDLDGRAWSQQGAAKGYVLVDFWASWCAPCLKEIPALNELQSRYGPAGKLSVLGLSLDKGGRPAIQTAARKHGVRYAVAPVDPAVAEAYKVQGFPSAFLVKDGRIVLTLTGERTLAAFERDLGPYLK